MIFKATTFSFNSISITYEKNWGSPPYPSICLKFVKKSIDEQTW